MSINRETSSINRENSSKISNVSDSINELNQYIPKDKSIRMILFLWSKFSKKSIELINTIPPECKRFFHFINIDNPSIRKSILNSSSIKISNVPCIVVVNTDGVISTYEGENSIEIIKSIHDLLQTINSKQNEVPIPPLSEGVTSLASILGNPPPIETIPEQQSNQEVNEDYTEQNVRSKIRRAERPMDTNTIIPFDDHEIGLSSARTRPIRGMGHDNLATSSLGSDISSSKSTKPSKLSQNIQHIMDISEGEMIDDGLDDMLEEDATMDPVIKGVKNSKSDDVKKVAEEMMRIRDEQVQNEDNTR